VKNNKAKASKKSKGSEKRYLKDDAIDNYMYANAYGRNLSHSERSISISMVEHTMIIAQESRRRSRAIQRLFGCVDLKQKRVGYPSVMHLKVIWPVTPRISMICTIVFDNIILSNMDTIGLSSILTLY
jgi:hypothetical protein